MRKMLKIYNYPKYYEIAFSFRNIKKEVDFFEKCTNKFSKIRVKNILEIACGNSPYLFELNKRRYKFTGLDLNEKMLKFSIDKARKNNIKINTLKANLVNFKTKNKYDFAFCMLGSIFVKSNKEFLSHLDSVASSLKKGGLYIFEGNIKRNFKPEKQKWTTVKDGARVTTIYEEIPIDFINQLFKQKITINVKENGRTIKLKEEMKLKYIFPQEFLELLKINNKFDFIGWFDNFNKLQKNPNKFSRTLTVLIKK